MQRRIASFVAVALLLVATPTFADDQITGNSIRMNGRSSAVPSTAGYGSFWYDITTHKFMRSENGGAASDFSAGLNSGVTTCVSGAVGRLLYTAAGLAVKCDATSPQWDPVTGTFGISGSAPFVKLGTTNSGIGADAEGFVQIYGGGVFLDGQSLPAADIGFIDVVPPNEDMQFDVTVYGAAATDPDDRTTAVIVTNGGPLRIFAGGYDGSFESWKYGVDGSLSSVGAGRNLTVSGVLTLGAAALAVSDLSTGKLLMATTDHPVKTFTATYDPASLAAQTGRTDTVTVTGIKLAGGAVAASPGVDAATGCVLGSVRASADDTVKITWFNAITAVTACDTASSTWTFTQQVN